jgi:membrane protein YqaA with SNARE-associated domain
MFVTQFIYLFFLSFLASTIVPLGSEWFLIKLVSEDANPIASVTIASIGNYLGALTTYYIGIYGSPVIIEKVLRVSSSSLEKAKVRYKKYGSWSLLFSWVPIIGDPICLAGGILSIRLKTFTILVLTGKVLRYALIAYITLKVSK